jgi:hypothetical protein
MTQELLSGNAAANPAATFAAKLYYNADWARDEAMVSGVEGWRLVGGGHAGFRDGPFYSLLLNNALFNTPADIELSGDGTQLLISDFMNNRIRSVFIKNQTVSTVLGAGGAAPYAWRFGGTATTATALSPLGIGFSATNKGDLIVVLIFFRWLLFYYYYSFI